MVNLERTCVLLFYYFLCLKANLDLEKTNQLDESSPNFIFAVVNLDPIILEKRWIDGESWPNDFVEKVNRGEDLRWVGSRCPLMHAWGREEEWVGLHSPFGIFMKEKMPQLDCHSESSGSYYSLCDHQMGFIMVHSEIKNVSSSVG